MSWLPNDRDLLTRFRAGDRKALVLVYQHYAPQLSALVYRGLATHGGRVRVSGPFEVGAVVQEAFARAFTERARLAYDGLAPYLSYLSAIARNHLLNERRVREEPAPAEALDAAAHGNADGEAALASGPRRPDEAAEENELRGLVDGFLATCGPNERGVFRARFVEGKTQDEAAAALGLTRIQVRRVEAHLRRDLLARIQQSGYLEGTRPQESSLLGSGVPRGVGR